MFSRKDTAALSPKTVTIIAEGVKIEGKLYSPGSTRVDGILNGEIVSDKEIIIGKEGKVEANIRTQKAVIAGLFKGEMIASGEVDITSTGKFIGNLIQKDALLSIEKGGLFKGESIISEDNNILEAKDSKEIATENKKELSG